MRLDDLIPRDAIVPRLSGTTPEEAIRELARVLVASGEVASRDADGLLASALARERAATTGFGNGVAVPHAKAAAVTRPAAAVGVSAAGIDFRAVDGRPVFVVVLLLSPPEAERHLAAMNALWPVLADPAARRALRLATTREQVAEVLLR